MLISRECKCRKTHTHKNSQWWRSASTPTSKSLSENPMSSKYDFKLAFLVTVDYLANLKADACFFFKASVWHRFIPKTAPTWLKWTYFLHPLPGLQPYSPVLFLFSSEGSPIIAIETGSLETLHRMATLIQEYCGDKKKVRSALDGEIFS